VSSGGRECVIIIVRREIAPTNEAVGTEMLIQASIIMTLFPRKFRGHPWCVMLGKIYDVSAGQ
jgi:hypothetical protein